MNGTKLLLSFVLLALASASMFVVFPAPHAQTADAAASQSGRALPRNRFFPSNAGAGLLPGTTYMRTAVGDDYFDGTSPLSRVRRHFASMRRAGVKYLRCAFSWDAIESRPGQYNWRFWDALVDLASQNGITLLPYVAYTPKWAAQTPSDFWRQRPRDPRLYANFMHTIAQHYRGKIRSWEIWNEPDNKDYWTGTADQFAPLVTLAARSIRAADPGAVLILGGMAYGPSPFFTHLIEHYHIDDYVDVIGMHAYPESWDDERAETVFQQWIPAMRNMIAHDGSGDPLWVNEMGYADYRFAPNRASKYGISIFYDYEHTRVYQAEMLFKFEAMALAAKVPLADWYRIDDFPETDKRLGSDFVNDHLGLVDATGKAKSGLAALTFFNRLLGKPVEVVRPQIAAPAHSQSVMEVFEPVPSASHRSLNTSFIVVGWLRSSHEDEIGNEGGALHDTRAETVSVELPCVSAKLVSVYDAEGNREASPAQVSGSTLTDVPLRGDRLFIARVDCSSRN